MAVSPTAQVALLRRVALAGEVVVAAEAVAAGERARAAAAQSEASVAIGETVILLTPSLHPYWSVC